LKIPTKIKIGGHEFSISIIEGGTRFTRAGDVCNWDCTIRINSSDKIAESSQAEALLHEIIEAINHANELKIEHSTICTLSEQLFAVIRNNKLDFIKK